jgi:SAM-dependent methyltransferase
MAFSATHPRAADTREVARRILRSGAPLELRMEGASMEPSIRRSQNVRVRQERPPSSGDVVLIDGRDGFVVHRLVGWVWLPTGGRWIHRGDADDAGVGLAAPESILGLVTTEPGSEKVAPRPVRGGSGGLAGALLALVQRRAENAWFGLAAPPVPPAATLPPPFPRLDRAEEEEMAERYDAAPAESLARLAELDRLLYGTAPGRTLELGCGTGRALRPLLAAGVAAFGIDRSLAMLRRAHHVHGVPCAGARGEALPVRDAAFDTVISANGAMHCMEWRLAFAEAARVLRPGGRFAFHVYPADAVRPRAYQELRRLAGRTPPGDPDLGVHDLGAIADAVRGAGFEHVRIHAMRNVRVRPWLVPLPTRWWRMATHVVFEAIRTA